jgi:hypothetical protein
MLINMVIVGLLWRDLKMTISDGLMIMAVLVAPFLAVFVQKKIETWKSQRDMKLWIFKTLMATRGATLSREHVEGLNMIDLEFSDKDKKERVVKQIWKEYLDHLASLPQDPEAQKVSLQAWSEKNSEYLAALLKAMGSCFGYDFDKVQLKKGIYSPEGHARYQDEQRLLRFLGLEVLSGRKPLRTLTSIIPAKKEAVASGQEQQKTSPDIMHGEKDFTMPIKKDNAGQPSGE